MPTRKRSKQEQNENGEDLQSRKHSTSLRTPRQNQNEQEEDVPARQKKMTFIILFGIALVILALVNLGKEACDLSKVNNTPSAKANTTTEEAIPGEDIISHPQIPLPELTRALEEVNCPEGMIPVPVVVNRTADQMGRIPRTIHQTGEGKCLTPPFYKATKEWSNFEGYSYYFHDHEARMQLLNQLRPEFPQLQMAFQCLKHIGGAAVADLWRYVVLWEYGGVYTDLDNWPNKLFTAQSINPQMDGYFLRAGEGFPSQYHFGVAPRHPMMYLAIQDVMKGMFSLDDVGKWYVPRVTGPSCLHRSALKFMGIRGEDRYCRNECIECCRFPDLGHHVGLMNRTIDIIGSNTTVPDDYVALRRISGPDKTDGWKRMNYTFYLAKMEIPVNKTCLEVLMDQHYNPTT